MGSKAPGWVEQWSAEGYGGNDDDDKLMNKVGNSSGSKMGDVKAAASPGLCKAKAAASVSAQKVKSGTSVGIKWVKNQYQKKVQLLKLLSQTRRLDGGHPLPVALKKPVHVPLSSLFCFQPSTSIN
uniref:Uncharacterized protein n=1 Tax=Quercus lobata TaxID=97700 RepID=A0A7N2MQQ6_QUELO